MIGEKKEGLQRDGAEVDRGRERRQTERWGGGGKRKRKEADREMR